VLVSHSMEDVARLVDRIIVMNKGQVALTGTPREVFAQADELKQMGLDVPQITKSDARLRERGMDVPVDIYTVEQAKDVLRKVLEGKKTCLRILPSVNTIHLILPSIDWIPGPSWLSPFCSLSQFFLFAITPVIFVYWPLWPLP
jgi:hypothetical protein